MPGYRMVPARWEALARCFIVGNSRNLRQESQEATSGKPTSPSTDAVGTVERCLACEADSVGTLGLAAPGLRDRGHQRNIARSVLVDRTYPSLREYRRRCEVALRLSPAHHGLASEATLHRPFSQNAVEEMAK